MINPHIPTTALIELVYADLRQLAERYLRQQGNGHTLQPTALVHEAYLRLAKKKHSFNDRAHVLAVGARAIRQILVDHARRKNTFKRSQDAPAKEEPPTLLFDGEQIVDVLDVHSALERLAELAPRKSEVVELRIFGGLTIEDTAKYLGVSGVTVSNDWRFARAWMARELEP